MSGWDLGKDKQGVNSKEWIQSEQKKRERDVLKKLTLPFFRSREFKGRERKAKPKNVKTGLRCLQFS